MNYHAAICDDEEWQDTNLYVPKDRDERQWPRRCMSQHHLISTAKDFSVLFSSVLEKTAMNHKHISIDPDVLGGTPRISGTRIPVYMILDAIDHYGNLDGALTSYPRLTREQVSEAVSFAAEVLEHPVEHKP